MLDLNVFRKEMRLSRRSLVVWTAVVLVFVPTYLGFYPYILETGMTEQIERYPRMVTAALDLTVATMEDINLYHANVVMAYVLLLVSIHALMLAGALISRDADLGTAEFLYTRPATRRQIAAAKIAAFLAMTLSLWVVIFAASTATGLAVAPGEFNVGWQLTLHLAGLLATWAAGGVAFAVAPFVNQVQATTSLGVGIGLASFLLNTIGRMTDRLGFLRYLSLHYHAGFAGAATGEPFVGGMLTLLLVFLAGAGLGVFFLNRKEFTA